MRMALIFISFSFGLMGGFLFAEDAKKKKADWKGSISLSANFVDGNTNSTNQRLAIDAKRVMHDGSMDFNGEYNEGSSEGETSVRNSTFGLKYNYDISPKEYLFIGYEIQKDKFKNLDLKNKALFGYGRKIINEEKTTFNLEFGGAWVREDYLEDSSTNVRVEPESYWAIRFGDEFSHVFENGVEIFQKGEYVPSLENSRDYSITSNQGVRTKLTQSWSMETSVKLVYVNNIPKDVLGNPIPRDDGRSVRRLDTYYYVGLNYSF